LTLLHPQNKTKISQLETKLHTLAFYQRTQAETSPHAKLSDMHRALIRIECYTKLNVIQ